jgi:hypothetical protein
MSEQRGASTLSTKQSNPPSRKKRWAEPWDLELVDWHQVNWLMKHHGLTEEEALKDAKLWA